MITNVPIFLQYFTAYYRYYQTFPVVARGGGTDNNNHTIFSTALFLNSLIRSLRIQMEIALQEQFAKCSIQRHSIVSTCTAITILRVH